MLIKYNRESIVSIRNDLFTEHEWWFIHHTHTHELALNMGGLIKTLNIAYVSVCLIELGLGVPVHRTINGMNFK